MFVFDFKQFIKSVTILSFAPSPPPKTFPDLMTPMFKSSLFKVFEKALIICSELAFEAL